MTTERQPPTPGSQPSGPAPSRRPNFGGLRVVSFESRRAADLEKMLQQCGANAVVAPSMREIPLEERGEIIEYARRLIDGQFDLVILMTGVGLRQLIAAVEGVLNPRDLINALGQATTLARGPKPVMVLREWGLRPTYVASEPNTWRELLATIDQQELDLHGKHVAVQEYGISNTQLLDALRERGAEVTSVRIYRWDLPEDTEPLERAVRAIASGQADVLMFTSSPQVLHVLRMAAELGLLSEFKVALNSIVVASVGPTTSEALREQGLPVDVEPPHPKIGHLVSTTAARAAELVESKRSQQTLLGYRRPSGPSPITLGRNPAQVDVIPLGPAPGQDKPGWDSLFLRACRREPTDTVPVWLMRQAGRYMPEYRAVREKVSFLELCRRPDLCTEVMITAVQRLGVDAAIIFADLLPILQPMGMDLEFVEGNGPTIHNPLRESADLGRFRELEDLAELECVMETVRQTRAGLPDHIPVIGFAGAPFTLASYAIEGGASRNYLHTKVFMYRDPGAWDDLMGRLSRAAVRYLNAQIEAGAQAVQLFDSWVGCLGVDDYRRYVFPHMRSLIDQLKPDVPVIHFPAGNPALLPLATAAGGSVMGIDWRVSLDDAWSAVGLDRAIQGNLDPAVLLGHVEEIKRQALDILQRAGGRPGHIFNLGHGLLPETPVENAVALVDAVHESGHQHGLDSEASVFE